MRLLSLFVAVLGTQQVFGHGTSDKVYSSELCLTKSGSRAVNPVPTSTKVFATTVTVYKKTVKYATTTLTPRPFTVSKCTTTKKTVTNTASGHTDVTTTTSTSTITVSTTETETETATTEVDTTITTGSLTSTVPTPPGFTPVQSIPGNTPVKHKRSEQHPRDFKVAALALEANSEKLDRRGSDEYTVFNSKNGKNKPKSYPQRIDCNRYIKTIKTQITTIQAHKTITKTAPRPIVTKTSTRTITTTSVLIPGKVTSTVTVSTSDFTTTTILSTSTTTSTITNTVTETLVPTATAYAACQPDNFVNSHGGVYINGFGWKGLTLSRVAAGDSVPCCEACQKVPECRGFIVESGSCYIALGGGQCPTDGSSGGRGLQYVAQPGGGWTSPIITIGNGNCWYSQYVGTFFPPS